MVFKACFIYSLKCSSFNSSTKIPELTTTWCSISRMVKTNALVDHTGLPLRKAINWSCCSLLTPAKHYNVNWLLSTLIWIDSHPITCGFIFLLLLVLCTIFKCAFWVVFTVATMAVSQCTNCCLHCCSVSLGGALLEAAVIGLNMAPITPGWYVSGAMDCCCGKVRKLITKRSGKSWRLYSELHVNMEYVTANFHHQFKLNAAAYRCTAYSCRQYPVLQFAVSCFDILWVFTGIHCNERRLTSHIW
jgi:hypothetical protein